MLRECGRRGGGVALLGVIALVGCAPTEPAESSAESAQAPAETGEVVAVVDGDTIDVATDAGSVRVRLIGIDTPEIGRGGAVDECYAQEARDFLNDLVYGRSVQLQADPTQADADR